MARTPPWNTDHIPDQTGRIIVITGANSGLGLASAVALAERGALVILACRDRRRGEQALATVRRATPSSQPELMELDLADLDSVDDFAAQLSAVHDHIDVLMNNAGVMALPQRRTSQGFEMQFGTNHLGHFALTGRLLPLLSRADAPRVVTTSSLAHRVATMRWADLNWESGRYKRWPAYAQSKLANLLFTQELARRSRNVGARLIATAAHPGYASTGLQQVGPTMSGRAWSGRLMQIGNSIAGQSATGGALPQLFAATSPDVVGGSYYGPGGPGEMRGAPRPATTSAMALSRDAGHRLWGMSEMLTGVRYDWTTDRTSVAGAAEQG